MARSGRSEAEGEEMMTADQAVLEMLRAAQRTARDKTAYGIYRHAEVEAWANSEGQGGPKTELGSQWARIAGAIGEAFHHGQKAQQWPELELLAAV